MPLSPAKSRHEGNWLHFRELSGGVYGGKSGVPGGAAGSLVDLSCEAAFGYDIS